MGSTVRCLVLLGSAMEVADVIRPMETVQADVWMALSYQTVYMVCDYYLTLSVIDINI